MDPAIQLRKFLKFYPKSLFSSFFVVFGAKLAPYYSSSHCTQRIFVIFIIIVLFVIFAVKLAPYHPSCHYTQSVFASFAKIVVFVIFSCLMPLHSACCLFVVKIAGFLVFIIFVGAFGTPQAIELNHFLSKSLLLLITCKYL